MENLDLYKKIEIWNYQYNGVWYELHVDATEERTVFDVFAEKGKVTDEMRNHFDEVVSKINH